MHVGVGLYLTRNGLKARVLSVDFPTDRPAIGYVLSYDEKPICSAPATWTLSGLFFPEEGESCLDLIEEIKE